jgi:hypothetical protein
MFPLGNLNERSDNMLDFARYEEAGIGKQLSENSSQKIWFESA